MILRAYDILPNLLTATEKMYSNTKARVASLSGDTELFDIAGVLQGDTLAPFLLITLLDYAMGRAMTGNEEEIGFIIAARKSQRQSKECLADLDFADDITALENAID